MKYILVLWYLAILPLGESVTGSGFEEMPNVHGAAIENLNREKVTVILARFDDADACKELGRNIIENYVAKVALTRTVEVIEFDCFQDPKS